MKFICTKENLNRGLQIVSHIASKNTTLPILNNVLLTANQGILTLATTNLEIGMNSIVRGRVEDEGTFTVTAKLLSDYINLLPNDQIVLEMKDNVLHIQCGNHQTKINGLSAEEFPVIPEIESAQTSQVNARELKKSLMQVVFAAANDDSRPEISGVYFQFENDNLTIAATDGHRLAEKKFKLTKGLDEPKSIIVPQQTVQELVRSIGDNLESDQLDILVSDNQIKFSFSGTEIISRLVEGQYPDYQQILPSNFKTSCEIKVTSTTNLVKSASLFCRMGMNDITMHMDHIKQCLLVNSENSQVGENKASLEAKIEGDSNMTVLSYRYILDGLSNIAEEDAKIELIDNQNAVLFRPAKSDDYRYIVMPIRN